MGAAAENFKGIEFVRISSLPDDQRESIWNTIQRDKIIKIVKDKTLMNDCILYRDYLSWLTQQNPAKMDEEPAHSTLPRFALR